MLRQKQKLTRKTRELLRAVKKRKKQRGKEMKRRCSSNKGILQTER